MRNTCETCDCGSATYSVTLATEDAIITAVERQPSRNSLDTVQELGLSQSKVLQLPLDKEFDPYHFSRNTGMFPITGRGGYGV